MAIGHSLPKAGVGAARIVTSAMHRFRELLGEAQACVAMVAGATACGRKPTWWEAVRVSAVNVVAMLRTFAHWHTRYELIARIAATSTSLARLKCSRRCGRDRTRSDQPGSPSYPAQPSTSHRPSARPLRGKLIGSAHHARDSRERPGDCVSRHAARGRPPGGSTGPVPAIRRHCRPRRPIPALDRLRLRRRAVCAGFLGRRRHRIPHHRRREHHRLFPQDASAPRGGCSRNAVRTTATQSCWPERTGGDSGAFSGGTRAGPTRRPSNRDLGRSE